jgi:hypothetical protein
MNTLHRLYFSGVCVTLQCQNQPQHNPPTISSTSSDTTIDLSKDDKVTVVTRWDVELCKKPSYRIPTAFYFCCRRCHRHSILLLLPLLPPLPSSTAATAMAALMATAFVNVVLAAVMKMATVMAEARATRAAMAAARTTALVMMAATVGAMLTVMATVHIVSTAVAAALAMRHQSQTRQQQQHDNNMISNTTTNMKGEGQGNCMVFCCKTLPGRVMSLLTGVLTCRGGQYWG